MNIESIINTFIIKLEWSTTDIHSWESTIVSLIVMMVSLALYVFWTKKKALINFRAWSLLMFVLNLVLVIHYSPVGPHLYWQLGQNGIRFLMLLQFATSAITIFRLWQISEKYLPEDFGAKSFKSIISPAFVGKVTNKTNFLARLMALGYVLKNGGNHVEMDKKLSKNIKDMVKKSKKL